MSYSNPKSFKEGMKSKRKIIACLITFTFYAYSVTLKSPAIASPAVASTAKAVSVKIEGSTSGSGVIVGMEKNRYIILTAWHVIRDNNPGEEIAVFTVDGKQHKTSIERAMQIKRLDLGVIYFDSSNKYTFARINHLNEPVEGADSFVVGFPLPTTAVPLRIWRFTSGKIVANAIGSKIPKGYELLYDNKTLPGMSGGGVFDLSGNLVGIHGQGELDYELTQNNNVAVKTGINQAIPIKYWSDKSGVVANSNISEGGALIARAIALDKAPKWPGPGALRRYNMKITYGFNGYESEIINLATQEIRRDPSNSTAYLLRAKALMRYPGSRVIKYIEDNRESINRGKDRFDHQIEVERLFERGNNWNEHPLTKQQKEQVLSDLTTAHSLSRYSKTTHINLYRYHMRMQEYEQAILHLTAAINSDENKVALLRERALLNQYKLNDKDEACRDFLHAASLGDEVSILSLTEAFNVSQAFKYSAGRRTHTLTLASHCLRAMTSKNKETARNTLQDWNTYFSKSNKDGARNPDYINKVSSYIRSLLKTISAEPPPTCSSVAPLGSPNKLFFKDVDAIFSDTLNPKDYRCRK